MLGSPRSGRPGEGGEGVLQAAAAIPSAVPRKGTAGCGPANVAGLPGRALRGAPSHGAGPERLRAARGGGSPRCPSAFCPSPRVCGVGVRGLGSYRVFFFKIVTQKGR